MPKVELKTGISVYYEVSGEGMPLVFQGHSHLQYSFFQVPYFAKHYKVITFDRRGTGFSTSGGEDEWSIKTFSDDMDALLEAMGIRKAIVAGESLGGWIAAQFGLDHPEKASALILAGNSLYVWDLKRQWLNEAIAAVNRGDTSLKAIYRQPSSFDWEREGPYTVDPAFTNTKLGAYILSLLQDALGSGQDLVRMMEAAKMVDYRKRAEDFKRLQNVPTLVILGGNESQRSIELAYEWYKLIPSSEFLILPNAYHLATVGHPEEWNGAVHEFLKRHNL